jgi:predicted DNA-binding protein
MQQNNENVGKSTTMTVRIPTEVSAELDHLARDTKRSKAFPSVSDQLPPT